MALFYQASSRSHSARCCAAVAAVSNIGGIPIAKAFAQKIAALGYA